MDNSLEEYPQISVVIPTYNRKNKLTRLLKSLEKSTYPWERMDIIIVSDSTDGTSAGILKKFSDVKTIRKEKKT